jgi:hypothetical protein
VIAYGVVTIQDLPAVVPPPRVHRHGYFGVLAPNSPLRAAGTALALAASTTQPPAANPQHAAEPAHRRAAHYPWARLLARIYEVSRSGVRPRPALWDLPDAGPGSFDPQPAPEYEFDQRITW